MSFNIQNVSMLKSSYPKRYDAIPIGTKVKATMKVQEGNKVRNQVFEGILIKKKNNQGSPSVTIRKMSFGVGVERVIALDCVNLVDFIPVMFHAVRRSKLYYLRALRGKSAKLSALYGISQAQLAKQFEDAKEDVEKVETPTTEPVPTEAAASDEGQSNTK